VTASLAGIPAPFTVRMHDRLGSTSDEAKALAMAGAPHGTVVVARQQTAGRGRLDRAWWSPPGNLYLSAILRPSVPGSRAAELGFLGALTVADTVEACLPAGPRVALKWPNDVLVNGAKIAGILPESEVSGENTLWSVLGIGLNVAAAPETTLYPAISLAALLDPPVTVDQIIPVLLERLGAWWDGWTRHGFGPVRAAWLQRAYRLGQRIEVRLGTGLAHGRFEGLDADGALLLATDTGWRRITTGEVAFGAPPRS
jgi:BirA family transcriptional regulator, biotin operon repressor / biotin---[acetyl-CoA-carboxylase] ligase